jgi:hypothetical protein
MAFDLHPQGKEISFFKDILTEKRTFKEEKGRKKESRKSKEFLSN